MQTVLDKYLTNAKMQKEKIAQTQSAVETLDWVQHL